jgi:hemolysin activation/secretion protein
MFAGVCRLLAVCAMVSVSFAAVAQVIPPSELPGRERERFTTYPTTPTDQAGAPTVGLPSAAPPPGAAAVFIVIRDVQIAGSTVYSPAELAQYYAEFVGRRVPLTAVYEIAKRITDRYGVDGYVLSRAVIESQTLDPAGAVVRFRIVEGYVDKVVWPNELLKYRDLFSEYAAKITAERPVNLFTIERYLLLAGDLPGLRFKNRLVPSRTHPGAGTLIVEVTEKPVDAMARLDNLGTEARGPLQYLASASFKNPLRIHDAWTFTYAGTAQFQELQYFSGNYRQVLNSEGLSFYTFGAYGFGWPGTVPLQSINYRTKGLEFETGLTQPLVRTRERNVSVTALYFQSDDQSELTFSSTSPLPTLDRLRGFRLRLEADWVDPWSGVNQFYGVFSQGLHGLGSTNNDDPFSSRFFGRVDFTKFEATYARLQALGGGYSFFVAALAQYAATPLLFPEVCGYGGRVFGRAYDPSQLVADNCAEILGELRYDLPPPGPIWSQVQFYLYADHAWLRSIAPFNAGFPVGGFVGPFGTVPTTLGNVNAASAGGGLRLGWLNAVTADLYAVKAIEGPRDDWRFRFIVTSRY